MSFQLLNRFGRPSFNSWANQSRVAHGATGKYLAGSQLTRNLYLPSRSPSSAPLLSCAHHPYSINPSTQKSHQFSTSHHLQSATMVEKYVPKDGDAVLPLFSLKGRTAIVTGAGAGIGLAVADALAEAGANVAIWYNSNKKAVERAQEIADKWGVTCT